MSHNTDAAIVALADYAAREVIAEIRRDEEPLQDAPVVKLIVRLAAELRAEGRCCLRRSSDCCPQREPIARW